MTIVTTIIIAVVVVTMIVIGDKIRLIGLRRVASGQRGEPLEHPPESLTRTCRV